MPRGQRALYMGQTVPATELPAWELASEVNAEWIDRYRRQKLSVDARCYQSLGSVRMSFGDRSYGELRLSA